MSVSAPLPATMLILGGARSGKTRRALDHAERVHLSEGLSPVYVATAQAFDDEMHVRIAAHQAERGPHWMTLEAPMTLAETIQAEASPDRVLLIDCLTLWLTNQMLAEADCDSATDKLLAALDDAGGPVIAVSNEVGLGIVPENALARRFRDAQGALNRRFAERANRVELIAAGLPLVLKG